MFLSSVLTQEIVFKNRQNAKVLFTTKDYTENSVGRSGERDSRDI